MVEGSQYECIEVSEIMSIIRFYSSFSIRIANLWFLPHADEEETVVHLINGHLLLGTDISYLALHSFST